MTAQTIPADNTRYDLIVIGAGINGASIARDAAMRGLQVLLLDKHDIASGTTSWSTRLIHGGLRYLEHAEIALVRESLRERERLLHNAPHLVHPLPLILPIYRGAKRGPLMIRAGMVLYDILSFDKSLPRHSMLDREEAMHRVPGLDADGLEAAARYYDAQVTFPERLTVEIVRSAIQHGARLKTYTEVTRILTEGSVVLGVEATDLASSVTSSYQGRAVVNVTGPWVDETLADVPADRRPSRQMGGTKGTHLVVPGFPDAPPEALYVEAKSDGRPLFMVPWNDAYLIGTTDTRFSGDLDEVHATRDEIDYLLRETNALFPTANLTIDDVSYTYSGVRPLPYTEGGAAGAITRKHIVKDHAPKLKGLWSIIGGKLTTHRELAEAATDEVCKALGIEAKCRTRRMPLPGAAGVATKAYAKALRRDAPLSGRTTDRLTRIYGALAEEIITLASGDPGLSEVIDPATGAIAAEVVYGFEREGAVTLEDLLMRRTMLGLEPNMAIGVDEQAAAIAGRYLGWDTAKQQEQVAAYREHVAAFKRGLRAEG